MENAIDLLENIRKGKTGNETIDNIFQEFYAPGNPPEALKGWDFRPEKVEQAFKKRRMYHADIDTPNRKCQLACQYCFVHGDPRYKGQKILTFEEWKSSMAQLKGEGVESVKIVGQGETTDDPRFLEYLKILNELKITPVVFTSGYIFGDDNESKRIHNLSGSDLITKTLELGASVMIKFDSPRNYIQDTLVRKKGYSEKRNEAIRRFLKREIREKETARFGLETNLGTHNIDDILSIYALRYLAGIHPDVCLTMDCNALKRIANQNTISGLTREQIENVYAGIHFLNENLGMRNNGISPYIGVMKCSQVSLPSLYLTGGGDIYFACCGNAKNKLGNIRETSIKKARKKAIEISQEYNLPKLHGCPFRESAGIMHQDLEKNVQSKLEGLRKHK